MLTEPLWLTANVARDIVEELATAMALPRRVASWLVARNITTVDEARRFLFAREQWSDPYDFHDMQAAVSRIKQAIDASELIVIVGDYDVDGVTSSAILATELAAIGAQWACMIPERIGDGYGLSVKLIERAKEMGASLIITVDNGIRADDAVLLASDYGMDVVVTDHHEKGDTVLPICSAVVHWSRHTAPENAKLLSGAGVAWKLTQALAVSFPQIPHSSEHHDWLLGLAAIGAVSDMMPVRGENRRLIREGLTVLEKVRRPGWLALCEQAGVDAADITATSIGWQIAPRLNAAGRIAKAETAFQLFMSSSRPEATRLASDIEQLNALRRQLTDAATRDAVDQITALYGEEQPSGIVVAGPWPLGVVGIVAARLVDKFSCPTLVLSDMDEDVLRGSGRAPDGWSLYGLLEACSAQLHHFGGHDAAVGCGVHRDKLDNLRMMFQGVAETAARSTEETREVQVVADDFLSLSEVTLETLDYTLSFSPFGPENEPLRFFVGPVTIVRTTPMGNGKHLRLRISEGKVEMDVVWFSVPEEVQVKLSECTSTVAMVVELTENNWQGTRRPQLRVLRLWRLSGVLTRSIFAQFYRLLHKNRIVSRDAFEMLAQEIQHRTESGDFDAVQQVEVVLSTFVELGFAAVQEGAYHVLETADSRDLREAIHYQTHLRTQLLELT